MYNKWRSRKFWLMVIAMVYSVAATLQFDIPVTQVVVVDAVAAVWILAEAFVDASHKEE